MPTGSKHYKITEIDGEEYGEECRCMIGQDHDEDGDTLDGGPADAEEIWLSSGMDEDYDFRD